MAKVRFFSRGRRDIDASITTYLDDAGRAFRAAARERCPVRTGKLRDSIGYIVRQSDRTMVGYADAPYAEYVELKHPFLRPALDSLRGFRAVTLRVRVSSP